jgi:peptidoglycan/xylan/chitin deacetylase (PgdA/CDA1 family)
MTVEMRPVTKLLKAVAASAGHLPFLRQAARWTAPLEGHGPNLVRVLTYHRILDAPAFEQQVAYLAANYRIVAMADLLAASQGQVVLAPRSVVLTFDDAYRNFAEVAWPILQRFGLPATLFVPTAFAGDPGRVFWWDRLKHALQHTERRQLPVAAVGTLPLATAAQRRHAFKQLRRHVVDLPHVEAMRWVDEICDQLEVTPPPAGEVLSWPELRRLARDGVTLGAHTRTHPFLHRLDPPEIEREIVASVADLERQVGPVLPIFAYPGGYHNQAVVAAVRRAGVALAFTTVRGANDLLRADPLRLRRNNIGERANLPVLQARLLHSSLYLDRWRPLTGAHGPQDEPQTKLLIGEKVTHENSDSQRDRWSSRRETAGRTRRHLRL